MGIAKSHLVSEVDALGGEIAKTGISQEFNIECKYAKSPVQSIEFNAIKNASLRIQKILMQQENLTIIDDMVLSIDTSKNKIKSITTRSYGTIYTNCAVICTGTFLRGRVLIGKTIVTEGRVGEESAEALSSSFEEFGFDLARLKTGTPEVHRDSVITA